MAKTSQEIVKVNSLPGQLLQKTDETGLTANNFDIFQGASGDFYRDISGRTVHTTIDAIRLMGANGIPDANANVQYFTNYNDCPGTWTVDASDTTSTDNTGTVLVTSGGKRLKRKFDKIINCQWFGTKGDGIQDDTTPLQNCFNNASGLEITVPLGTYLINPSTSLSIKSNTILSLSKGAILMCQSTSLTNYNVLLIGDVENIHIIGGTIDGGRNSHIGTTGEWGHCISILGSSNVNIDNTHFINAWGDGLYIGDDGSGNGCNNITVNGCIIDNNRRNGISVISANTTIIKSCRISNTNGTPPAYCIDIEPNATDVVNNVTISDCTFLSSNTAVGINTNAASVSNIFINNSNSDSSITSNCFSFSGTNLITNVVLNNFNATGGYGIYAQNIDGLTISNGFLASTTGPSIYIKDCNHANINSNVIDGQQVELTNNINILISNNVLKNSAFSSITYNNSADTNDKINITNNKFENATTNHIMLGQLTNSKIENNSFYKCVNDSIVLNASNSNMIKSNLFIGVSNGSSSSAIKLNGSTANVISENSLIKDIGTPAFFAILDSTSQSNYIINNSFKDQVTTGGYSIANYLNKIIDFLKNRRTLASSGSNIMTDDVILLNSSSGPITITLDNTGNVFKPVMFKKISDDNNKIRISGTIDSYTAISLINKYDSIELIPNSGAYFIKNKNITDVIDNSITDAQTSSQLNTLYPNMIKGSKVVCPNITGGGQVYTFYDAINKVWSASDLLPT